MFLKRIAFTFSKHHHHLGFKHPVENPGAIQLAKEALKIENPEGFVYAFNNLIASINHEDFLDFANKTCDPQLVKAFESGLQKLKDNNQFIEPIFDPEIEEEVIYAEPTFCFEIDNKTSYYEQNPVFRFALMDTRFEFYNPLQQIMSNLSKLYSVDVNVSILMDCFIKCKTSLKIQQFDMHPYNYHLVKFQLIKTSDQQTIKEFYQALFKGDISKKLLGDQHHWRIINIDNFLKK